jgi:hypothetical protein
MGEGSFGIVHEGYIGKGEEWNERWYLDMQDDNTVHLSGPGYSPCIIHCRDYAFLLWNWCPAVHYISLSDTFWAKDFNMLNSP